MTTLSMIIKHNKAKKTLLSILNRGQIHTLDKVRASKILVNKGKRYLFFKIEKIKIYVIHSNVF